MEIVKTYNIHFLNFVGSVEINITEILLFTEGVYERIVQNP
jgi:hypothetical protein